MADDGIKWGALREDIWDPRLILSSSAEGGIGVEVKDRPWEDAKTVDPAMRWGITPLEGTYRFSPALSLNVAGELHAGSDSLGYVARFRAGIGTDRVRLSMHTGKKIIYDNPWAEEGLVRGGELYFGLNSPTSPGVGVVVGLEQITENFYALPAGSVDFVTVGLRYTLPWFAWDRMNFFPRAL